MPKLLPPRYGPVILAVYHLQGSIGFHSIALYITTYRAQESKKYEIDMIIYDYCYTWWPFVILL